MSSAAPSAPVAAADRLIVEVRIDPQDIDQVKIGQPTRGWFSAFNQRTTPDLWGTLFGIGGRAVC